jgi:chromosome partitioning protein
MAVTITIANEKGGVGKTTTAVNMAAGLAICLRNQNGKNGRVLLIDADPQGHALLSTAFGQHTAEPGESIAALLIESPPPSVQKLIRQSTHHSNLFFVPGNRSAMTEAARTLPTLMANESRLVRSLASIQNQFAYVIIDTPPNTGDLLNNALVCANYVLIPVETSYLGVSGLMELQRTIEAVKYHFRPNLQIMGYLPTLCDEQRSETHEILSELQQRYSTQMFNPIHKSTDLAYAHSSHADVFTYRPPRQRQEGKLSSSSRSTQEYADLVENILKLTWQQASSAN